MKKFSERAVLISTIIAFLGFTLIGITLKSTIIGIILFVPMTIIRNHNLIVEDNLSYFKFGDLIKLIPLIFKTRLLQ